MPMLHPRQAFDDISLVNDLYWLSPFLVIASALGDQQNLTTRMGMPIQLRAGIISRHGDTGIEGTISYIQLFKPDVPRMMLIGG